jgi:hypothetical protein
VRREALETAGGFKIFGAVLENKLALVEDGKQVLVLYGSGRKYVLIAEFCRRPVSRILF